MKDSSLPTLFLPFKSNIGMKVLLYGEYWDGTHVDCISRVLHDRGIEHRIFDFFPLLHRQFGNRYLNSIYRRAFYVGNERKINEQLLKTVEAFRPDVLLVSKGINIYADTLHQISKKSILILNWNPDDFFNEKNSSRHLQESIGIYDYVFSARPHLFEEYIAKGIKSPVHLEWYYIPWLHKKMAVVAPDELKITFVGTYSKRRENIIDSIEIDIPVEIWGDGWHFSKLSRKRNLALKKQALKQSEFPDIMAGSLFNLNILTVENRDMTNLKLFEITASYGLLLTEFTQPIYDIFGQNCLYYHTDRADDLNKQLTEVMQEFTPADLHEIRENGYRTVTEGGHDIATRVNTILGVIAHELKMS